MTLLVAVILAGIGLWIQIRPLLGNRYFGVDTWRHLVVADYIRCHRHYPGRMPDKYLIDEPCDYPPLFRYVLALIPKRLLEHSHWLVSPSLTALHSLLLFGVTWRLTASPAAGWLAQVIYGVTPLVVMENASMTTRACSSLLFTVAAGGLMAGVMIPSWGWGIGGVMAVALLVLTHKMAVQALAVLVVGWGMLSGTPWYPVGMVAGMAVAAVLSRGFYVKVLTGHLAMLRWWRQNIRYRYAHQVRGLPRPHETTSDKVFWIYQQIRKAPWVAVVGANPWMVVVLGFGAWAWRTGRWAWLGFPAPITVGLVQWCVILWVTALAIRSIPAIEFLGEGERYAGYASFPTALLVSTVIWHMLGTPRGAWVLIGVMAIAVLGCLLPVFVLQRTLVVQDDERSVTPALRELYARIDALPGEVRLASFPLHLADSAMYFTRAKVLSTDSTLGHLKYYTPFFPVLRVPVATLIQQYRLTHLLINEHFANLSELRLDASAVLARAGSFCVVRVNGMPLS